MKTQQRSFTVEIKSSRRRSKMQPKSIWGDTDFKALAREAEAAHLFKSNVVPVTVAVEDAEGAAEARSDFHIIKAGDSVEQEEIASAVADTGLSQPLAERLEPVETTVAPKRISRRADHDVRRSRREIAKTPAAKLSDASKTELVPLPDDLEQLEDENRHLRMALIRRLQHENAVLRKMLARLA